MSDSYLIFLTRAGFELWLSRVNAALGLPNAATMTATYTEAMQGVDLLWYAKIDEHCPPGLRAEASGIVTDALTFDPLTGAVTAIGGRLLKSKVGL